MSFHPWLNKATYSINSYRSLFVTNSVSLKALFWNLLYDLFDYHTQHLLQLYIEFHIDFLRVGCAVSKTKEDLPDKVFLAMLCWNWFHKAVVYSFVLLRSRILWGEKVCGSGGFFQPALPYCFWFYFFLGGVFPDTSKLLVCCLNTSSFLSCSYPFFFFNLHVQLFCSLPS